MKSLKKPSCQIRYAVCLISGTMGTFLPFASAHADNTGAPRNQKISDEKVAAPPKTPLDEEEVASKKPRLRLRIAVDQFKWNETRAEWYTLPRDVREGLQAALVAKLTACGYFQVMEREATALAQGNQERQFDQEKREGQNEPAKVTLPPRQKVTPARYIITPTVTGLQRTGSGKGGFHIGPFQNRSGKMTVTLTIDLRISDAETSAVLDTASAEGKQETREDGFKVDLGGLGYGKENTKQTPFSKVVEAALNDAVDKIVARLGKEPWTALIAAQDTSTGRIIINAGKEAGVVEGMEFDVLKPGGEVRDPDTGDLLTRGDEVKIGRIRVARVERNVAFCDIVDGKTFEPRQIIRFSH